MSAYGRLHGVGTTRGRARGHLALLLAVGVAGWLLVASTIGTARPWPPLAAVALFLVVIAATRALAFPLVGISLRRRMATPLDDGRTEVSLDSAIFIAATVVLGAHVTAPGVAVILSIDALVRGVSADRTPCKRSDRTCVVAYALFAGGLSGGLIAGLSRLVGGVFAKPLVEVAVLGATFLVAHYLVQTVQHVLAGKPLGWALKRNTIGVACEATLLPLACAIVVTWDPARPTAFALLGGTYVLVNFGFNRLAHLAHAMKRRARELEALNRAAHALGASLEAEPLVQALLRECASAMPHVTRFEAIVRRGAGHERFVLRPGHEPETQPVDQAARALLKLRGPVVEPLPGGGTRLAVPLLMYGETIGALAAECLEAFTFGPDEVRLLDAIAGQAATAVENARLYGLANIDGLTGLYCRRYFDQRIAEEIERARRFGSSFALIMLDLDDFKKLNDTLGHVAGDRALREVSAIAASQLRGVDLAARFGGEELAFLLPRTSLADAHAVAERIRDAVSSYSLVDGGHAWKVTASLGVAAWAESGADEPSTLLRRADAALYRAKALGKDRVEVDLVSFELTPALAPVRRRRA